MACSNSLNGFNAKLFGPIYWSCMEMAAHNYPIVDASPLPTLTKNKIKRGYMDFFKSFQYTIPCKSCRKHYVDHINGRPCKSTKLSRRVLRDRLTLTKWLYKLHKCIHTDAKSPSPKLTFTDVCRKYETLRTPESGLGCKGPLYGTKITFKKRSPNQTNRVDSVSFS